MDDEPLIWPIPKESCLTIIDQVSGVTLQIYQANRLSNDLINFYEAAQNTLKTKINEEEGEEISKEVFQKSVKGCFLLDCGLEFLFQNQSSTPRNTITEVLSNWIICAQSKRIQTLTNEIEKPKPIVNVKPSWSNPIAISGWFGCFIILAIFYFSHLFSTKPGVGPNVCDGEFDYDFAAEWCIESFLDLAREYDALKPLLP